MAHRDRFVEAPLLLRLETTSGCDYTDRAPRWAIRSKVKVKESPTGGSTAGWLGLLPAPGPRPALSGCRADRAQGALTEPLGIALTGFRKRDDALRKRRTNGVVMAAGGAERGQRRLKSNTHLTDRFAVELMT